MGDGAFIPGFSNKYGSQAAIEKVMKISREKLDKLEEEKEDLIERKKLLNEIKAKAIAVQKQTNKLYGAHAPFDDKVSLSTDEASFSANVNRNAEIGEYSIKIKQKAKSHKIASTSLSRNYKVPPGEYIFKIGKEKIQISFTGGSIDEFDNIIARYGKDIIRATVTNNTSKTQVLILESEKTGVDNYIQFGNDKTRAVFKKMGFFEEVASFIKKFKINKNYLKNLVSGNKPPSFINDGVLFLDTNDKYQFSLTENIPYKKKLIMEMDFRLTKKSQDEIDEKKMLPTGPDFKEIGEATILNIEIEGEPQLVDIPSYQKKNVKIEKPVIVEDDHYIEIITDKRTIKLDKMALSSTKKTYRFDLANILNSDEVITFVIFKNNNTLKNLEVSNLTFFDDETKDGTRFLNELSKPQDSIVYLDGLEIIRSSNTIDDLLKGVTLNVFDKTSREESLKVDRDYEKIMGYIIDFIGEYNQFLDMINTNTTSQADDDGKRGEFSSEYSLISLASKMRVIMMNAHTTSYGQELSMLSQIGISTNASGAGDIEKVKSARGILEVDEDKFISMMEKYAQGVKQLFGYDNDRDFIVDEGVAYEMERLLKSYTSNINGYFKIKSDTFIKQIKNQDKNIDNYKEKMDAEEQKLKEDFFKLEKAANEFEKNSKKFENFTNQNK